MCLYFTIITQHILTHCKSSHMSWISSHPRVWVHLRYGQKRARLKLMEDCRQHKILCFRIEYTKTEMWGNKRRLGMENHPKLLSSRVVSQSIEGIWGEQESMARAFFSCLENLSRLVLLTLFFSSLFLNHRQFWLLFATSNNRSKKRRKKSEVNSASFRNNESTN